MRLVGADNDCGKVYNDNKKGWVAQPGKVICRFGDHKEPLRKMKRQYLFYYTVIDSASARKGIIQEVKKKKTSARVQAIKL